MSEFRLFHSIVSDEKKGFSDILSITEKMALNRRGSPTLCEE